MSPVPAEKTHVLDSWSCLIDDCSCTLFHSPNGQMKEFIMGRASLLTSLLSHDSADQTLSLADSSGKCIFRGQNIWRAEEGRANAWLNCGQCAVWYMMQGHIRTPRRRKSSSSYARVEGISPSASGVHKNDVCQMRIVIHMYITTGFRGLCRIGKNINLVALLASHK